MHALCVCVSHVQTVFQHIGKALAILITLDHIFTSGGTFHEHWNQYKRYVCCIVCTCTFRMWVLLCT